MSFRVRAAVLADVPGISSWTRDTFSWGDYVPDRILGWMEDPGSRVMVCVYDDDVPVAVSHAVMLSATEGWLEGARVHPGHKRAGLGSAMNKAGVEWLREQGANVVRLVTEDDNTAARNQVEGLGYRATSAWVYARLSPERDHHVAEQSRLRPAHTSDVDPAWMFWSAGDLYHDGRGLMARGWQWRRATPDDVSGASADKTLYQSPVGWVIARQPTEESLVVDWIATSTPDAPQMIDSLLSLAASRGATALDIKTPATPWMVESLRRAGADPGGLLVYSLPV